MFMFVALVVCCCLFYLSFAFCATRKLSRVFSCLLRFTEMNVPAAAINIRGLSVQATRVDAWSLLLLGRGSLAGSGKVPALATGEARTFAA